jgi:hypothetical protein
MAPPARQGMARKSRMPNLNRRASANGDTAVYISLASGVTRVCLPAGAREGACYVRAAVPRRRATLRGATAAAAAAALTLSAGCGGGTRQDAGEQDARYPVTVPSATFPARQTLAQDVAMRIAVRNIGTRTIPDVAATIEAAGSGTQAEAFARVSDAADLASRSRPVWIVNAGPFNGDTAYANTWALGPLGPNRTKTFVWRVTAVRTGSYTLVYRLSGSLTGRSQLRLGNGEPPHGSFTVNVSGRPGQVRVTPDGKIVSTSG